MSNWYNPQSLLAYITSLYLASISVHCLLHFLAYEDHPGEILHPSIRKDNLVFVKFP